MPNTPEEPDVICLDPQQLEKIGINISLQASNEEVESILEIAGKKLHKNNDGSVTICRHESRVHYITMIFCVKLSFTPEELKRMGRDKHYSMRTLCPGLWKK